MYFTKTFKKIVGLAFLMVLVSACSKNVDKASSAIMATFYVDSIDGTSAISKTDPVYLIPTSRIYNFKTCIKDIMQSKSIQGQSFTVSGGEIQKSITTDEQGCLNWSENIDYNFLAQSNFISIKRNIIATGIHKGSKEIELVLNPWSHGEETTGVIDPNKQTINSLVTGRDSISALTATGVRAPIWVLLPRVTIVQKEFTSNGASMMLKFQSKLSLNLKNTANQNFQYQILSGLFNVEMILYNSVIENGVEKTTLITNAVKNDVEFNQDNLVAEFPFNLNELPNKGQILLGIKISAKNSDIGLDPFDGIFLVSSNASINVDGTPSIVTDQKYEAVKNKLELKQELAKNEKKELAKPGVEIDKLEVRFFKLGTENTTDRQVFFNVKACMKNNIDGRVIRDVDFSVKTVSQKNNITIKSNQDGCISWDDSIWHKFFGSEHYVKNSVTISNQIYNLNTQIPIYLDPWDQGSNFGRDGRFVEDLGAINLNPSNEKTKISFENYNFSVSNYNYEINKNLDLTLIKKGTLSLSAKLVNHSSLSYGRMGFEPLRDGQYLLKWAVVTVDENQNLDTPVSSGQKIVNSFGGDIKTEIGFKVTAFDKLNIRSRIVVSLYTVKEAKLKAGVVEIDKNSGLEATPFIATIILNNDQDSQKLVQLDNNLGLGKGDVFDQIASKSSIGTSNDYTSKELQTQNLKKISLNNDTESLFIRDGLANPMKYYTKNQNPAYYHEADQKPAVNVSLLNQFAKTGKLTGELGTKMCSFWVNDYLRRLKPESKTGSVRSNIYMGMVQNCLYDPNKFFSTEKKIIVKKVGNYKYINGTVTNFNVGNTFSVSKAEASSKTQTWAWANSVGLSFEFLKVIKVGSTGSYTIASANSKTETTANAAQINASTYLFLQTSNFDIEFTSYEECSTIRLNPTLFIGKNATYRDIWDASMKPQEIAKVATSGFYLCTGTLNNTPITKRETYYLVSQDTSSYKGEQDGYSANNHQFFMTFRGVNDLNNFLTLIQSSVQLPASTTGFSLSTTNTKSNLGSNFSTLPTLPGAYSELNQ